MDWRFCGSTFGVVNRKSIQPTNYLTTMMNTEEQAVAIMQMREVSKQFYAAAVQIGNHPFIEITGLMNEYIKACQVAHESGIDFSECSAHSGQMLPMQTYMTAYVNEKLECIFTGRIALVHNQVET